MCVHRDMPDQAKEIIRRMKNDKVSLEKSPPGITQTQEWAGDTNEDRAYENSAMNYLAPRMCDL